MKGFTQEQKTKIQRAKNILKEMRQLNYKLSFLLDEKSKKENNDINFKNVPWNVPGNAREEMIDIQVEELRNEMQNFISKIYVLDKEDLEIISIYIESDSYKKMIDKLNAKGIEEYTYTRKIPLICLKIDGLIKDKDTGYLERANENYLKRIEGE